MPQKTAENEMKSHVNPLYAAGRGEGVAFLPLHWLVLGLAQNHAPVVGKR